MKRWLKIGAVAFLAFELWRIALAAPLFVAFWNERLSPAFKAMGDYPPHSAPYAIGGALLAFVIPMVGACFALRFLHRRLSRFWTGLLTRLVDRQLTKVHP